MAPYVSPHEDGWYWVRKKGWGDEYGELVPALWQTEYRSWRSAAFSGIPDSEIFVEGKIERLMDGMDFETKRLRRVAMLMGISVPESDEALRAAAGGVLGEIERAIERCFKVPNAELRGATDD